MTMDAHSPERNVSVLGDEKVDLKFKHLEELSSDGANGDLDSIEQTKLTSYVWLLTLWAALGGLLFGYDTGAISSVLVLIGTDLGGKPLSSNDSELITSLTSGGAFIGAVVAGKSSRAQFHRFGRKICILFAAILFTLGAVIQASSFSLAQMAAGRAVIGLGVGSAAMIVPVYIAEISPARHRGRMVSIDVISITGGQCISYIFGVGFQYVPGGWRYITALGAVPSIVLGALLLVCPESPRQLIYHQRIEEAAAVLRKIYPNATTEQVDDKVILIERNISQHMAMHEEYGIRKALVQLHTVPGNLRALVVACGVMGLSQMCGFNTLMYYSATLFKMVGFSNSIAVGIVIGATNFLFSCIAVKYIDRIGRRKMLIGTVWGMSASLAVAAIAFHWIPLDRKTLTVTTDALGWPEIVMLVSLILFVACFGAGVAPVSWQANELLPMEVRAVGTMVIVCTCWGTNIIVASTFLSMMKSITPSGTFGFYSALCAIGWVLSIFLYPEVAQMSLEEVRAVFQHGFGVKYARQWQKDHKQLLKNQRLSRKEASKGINA
ncbi:Myo-inositol transporter 1 [Hyphodiscus hymeniophilus]|uniref:Myo-inositol transporter 1 n=1 Tax=Hyphodiscus hymeniophilus TaxID=353542 RepID=A0A9P7AYC3_9HELO|nr:Myo-inositol transporter 1 [Hyphodiscus hymeniophilus]